MVVFPACRQRVVTAFVGRALPFRHAGERLSAGLRFLGISVRSAVLRGKGWLLGNPFMVLGALSLVVIPSLMAFAVRTPAVFDFSEETRLADRQIAVLLEGEQLVPPPAPPPEAFSTREVEMVRPDVALASRNWQLLDQEFTQRLLVLIEGYRSPERQAGLYEQGPQVTQVGANMSYHQYGLAADSAFFRDGKVVISERDPWAMRGYQLYGEIAEQVGLTWGGGWKMQDYGHVKF